MTTWGYYGKRNGRGDIMRPVPSKEEQEAITKAIIFKRLAMLKALGLKSEAQKAREMDEYEKSKGVCPVCHMQRALNGSCSC